MCDKELSLSENYLLLKIILRHSVSEHDEEINVFEILREKNNNEVFCQITYKVVVIFNEMLCKYFWKPCMVYTVLGLYIIVY